MMQHDEIVVSLEPHVEELVRSAVRRAVASRRHIVSPPPGRYLAADRDSVEGNEFGRVRLLLSTLSCEPPDI